MPGPVSVALDVSAVPANPAGAGRYVVELARELARRDDVALTLVTSRRDGARWHDTTAPASPRMALLVPRPRPLRLAYERLALSRAVGRLRAPAVEVHHGPHYTMPAPGGFGRVVTVHDVTFIEHPEWHERSKAPFFTAAIKRAARDADVVVCVSATTAHALGRLVDVRAEVVVAEHGVDRDRFSPGEVDRSVLPGSLGDGELVVHIGTLEPRKGLVDLVRSFDLIAADHPRARLALAGTPGWGASEVERAVATARHRDRIALLGFVDDDTVVALLRAASVVAYPSHEEGFGLPALEALSTGTPLVTTEGTTMAELAQGAPWLVPPGSPGDLARGIASALEASPEELARRRKLGFERAARYTWTHSADQHVEAYRLARERSAKRR